MIGSLTIFLAISKVYFLLNLKFIQLSEPFKIFEFDFWKRPDSYGENQLSIRATNNGQVHAVISW